MRCGCLLQAARDLGPDELPPTRNSKGTPRVGSSMVEQLPFKQLVLGSNPSQPTNFPRLQMPRIHRLVIIEDQTAVREMLVEVLAKEGHYELVGQCGDGHVGLKMCLDTKPDVVVLDAKLPGLNGVDLLRRLNKKIPRTRVLVFSGLENPVVVREMLEAGASGFVEKTAGFLDFKKGLAAVASGGTYFGPAIAAVLRNVVAHPETAASQDFLTEREREVLKLVAEGNSTKEIGSKLGISPKTVDNHRTNLMRKLNIHDVASLTRHALELGILEDRSQG
jgi:DNA-binding NarL/FixJ family response regulator